MNCYYCGREIFESIEVSETQKTRDHLPGRLLLRDRGRGITFFQADCCYPCNQEIKRDEEYLWSRLVSSFAYDENEPLDRFIRCMAGEERAASLRGYLNDIEVLNAPEHLRYGIKVDEERMDVVLQKFGRALVCRFFPDIKSWEMRFMGKFFCSQFYNSKEDFLADLDRAKMMLDALHKSPQNGVDDLHEYELSNGGRHLFYSKIRRIQFFNHPKKVSYIFVSKISNMIGGGIAIVDGTTDDIDFILKHGI